LFLVGFPGQEFLDHQLGPVFPAHLFLP
jgi:hypothetical protein